MHVYAVLFSAGLRCNGCVPLKRVLRCKGFYLRTHTCRCTVATRNMPADPGACTQDSMGQAGAPFRSCRKGGVMLNFEKLSSKGGNTNKLHQRDDLDGKIIFYGGLERAQCTVSKALKFVLYLGFSAKGNFVPRLNYGCDSQVSIREVLVSHPFRIPCSPGYSCVLCFCLWSRFGDPESPQRRASTCFSVSVSVRF